MSETKPKIQRDYPPTIKLDNSTEVSLRLMTPADTYRIVAFDAFLIDRTSCTRDLIVMTYDVTGPTAPVNG